MAKRISGQTTISMRWEEGFFPNMAHGGRYRCVVSNKNGRLVIYVGAPVCLTHAVDSPEAYDDTARAALSFAADAADENEWDDAPRPAAGKDPLGIDSAGMSAWNEDGSDRQIRRVR